MNKALNCSFMKLLIDFDFVITNPKSKNKDNYQQPVLLNIFKLQKEFKQFVKILLFLRKKNFYIFILVKNNFDVELLTKIIEKTNIKSYIRVVTTVSLVKFKRHSCCLLISMDNDIDLESNFNIFFQKNSFFLVRFSSFFPTKILGDYGISSGLDDIKKVLFIIALINTILKPNAKKEYL